MDRTLVDASAHRNRWGNIFVRASKGWPLTSPPVKGQRRLLPWARCGLFCPAIHRDVTEMVSGVEPRPVPLPHMVTKWHRWPHS